MFVDYNSLWVMILNNTNDPIKFEYTNIFLNDKIKFKLKFFFNICLN